MSKFKEGEKVFYEGKECEIDIAYNDNTYRVNNPFWSYDDEAQCYNEGIEYCHQYWIFVNEDELSKEPQDD